jgi:hypothetical protein
MGRLLDKPFSTILVFSFPWLVAGCLSRVVVVILKSPLAKVMDGGEDPPVSWRPGVTLRLLSNTAVLDQSM